MWTLHLSHEIFDVISFSSRLYAQILSSDEVSNLGIFVTCGDSEYGGGTSFADFDGDDGWDDLSFTSEDVQDLYFFKNSNGTFSAITFTGVAHTGKTK